MKKYLLTWISAAVAFISGIVALIYNPMNGSGAEKHIEFSQTGDIALIIALAAAALFIISFIVSVVSSRVKDRKMTADTADEIIKYNIAVHSMKYDEKYDLAEQRRKEREKRKRTQ